MGKSAIKTERKHPNRNRKLPGEVPRKSPIMAQLQPRKSQMNERRRLIPEHLRIQSQRMRNQPRKMERIQKMLQRTVDRQRGKSRPEKQLVLMLQSRIRGRTSVKRMLKAPEQIEAQEAKRSQQRVPMRTVRGKAQLGSPRRQQGAGASVRQIPASRARSACAVRGREGGRVRRSRPGGRVEGLSECASAREPVTAAARPRLTSRPLHPVPGRP